MRRTQEILTEKGYDPGPVDGLWGERTETAVRAFQRDKGLTADGVLGPVTLDALFAD